MTSRSIYDELYALKIKALNKALRNEKDVLISMPIRAFITEVGTLIKQLPEDEREKPETILAYAMYELEQEEPIDEEIHIFDNTTDKKGTDKKHQKSKTETIQHAIKHAAEESLQHPDEPQLAAKRKSLQKQSHLLNKKA